MNEKLISFCCHVKNRLQHVKLTLEFNLEILSKYNNVELILSDFDSNDGLFEWIKTNENLKKHLNSGLLKYFKINNEPYFKMATSKNLSHRLASGDYLINLDSDNFLCEEYIDKVKEIININLHTLIHKKETATALYGRVGLSNKMFNDLIGYDEIYEHWGCEDNDLLQRVRNYKDISEYVIDIYHIDPEIMGSFIEHSNSLRISNYNVDDLNPEALIKGTYDMFVHGIDDEGKVYYKTDKYPIFKINNQDYFEDTLSSDRFKSRKPFSEFDVYMLKNNNLIK
jgi:N-terminal domain of galactosyltransferase